MTKRGAAVIAAWLVLGLVGGYAASAVLGGQPTASGVGAPVVAESPSHPVDPAPELSDDSDFPVLLPGIATVPGGVGSGEFALAFPVPRGWDETRSSAVENKWYPKNNPGYTYGLRVEQVEGQHDTIAGILADRITDLEEAEEHVQVISRTSDSLHFTYVVDQYLRHGLLRWMDVGGSGFAEVEISVNGRARDLTGMEDLLDRVSSGMRRAG